MAHWGNRNLLKEGDRAPEFRLARLDGGETSLEEILSGGRALLVFFKISCPVCQFTMPFLSRLHTPGNVPVYGISQNDAADTHEFNQHFGVTFPVLLDREEEDFPASNAFGISSVPTLFLVEPGGSITRVVEGWNRAEIEWLGGSAGVAVIRAGEKVPEWKPG